MAQRASGWNLIGDGPRTMFYIGLALILTGGLMIYPRWSFVASAEPAEIEVYAVDVREEDGSVLCRPRLAYIMPDGRRIESVTSTWRSPCAHTPDDVGKKFPGYLDSKTGELMTEIMYANYKSFGYILLAIGTFESVVSVLWLMFFCGFGSLRHLNPLH